VEKWALDLWWLKSSFATKTPVRCTEVGKQAKWIVRVYSSKKPQSRLKEWKNGSNLYLIYIVGLAVHFLLTKSFFNIFQLYCLVLVLPHTHFMYYRTDLCLFRKSLFKFRNNIFKQEWKWLPWTIYMFRH